MKPRSVAIIGYAFRFPGTDRLRYWNDLLQGRDLVTEVDPARWSREPYLHPSRAHPGTSHTFAAGSLGDIGGFDAEFFGISPREAAQMDPQQRILLELAWEAMEHAGQRPSDLRGTDCGVYVGLSSVDYGYRIAEDLASVGSGTATGNASSIAANRISYVFDLHGPSMVVDTACSSSLVAVHQACQAIRGGEIAQALAGGIGVHAHPYGFVAFSKAGMLSPRGRSRAFDAGADGYVRSEGGGLFLLKDHAQALADGDRILAVIVNSATNTDGRKSGLTVPSARAQAELLRRVYAQAGVDPAQLDYLEAHGTGTAVGDPIEAQAIGQALGCARPAGAALPVGSVKSNLGHLEAASGVAGMVKALHCLAHRQIPATIGIDRPNPAIDFARWNLRLVRENQPLRAHGPLTVGVNSFGFGGANAHLILQSAAEPPPAQPARLATTLALPLAVSGRTPQALADAALAMAGSIEHDTAETLYDKAYQSVLRRDWHAHRAIVWGSQAAPMAASLREFATGAQPVPPVYAAQALPDCRGPVFLYSGNGSQWAGMGRRLLEDPVFHAAVREIDETFAPLAGYTLEAALAAPAEQCRYARTEFAQPALFAVQVGLTRMLAQRHIRPAAVAGHSVGEVAAAWASGALTLADATLVIYHRSRLQERTRGAGLMAAVALGAPAAAQALADAGVAGSLHIAARNSRDSVTVAGEAGALAVLETWLAGRRAACRRLDLDYAFHTPAMDPIEADVRQALQGLRPRETHTPFHSTVTGALLDGRELDGGYWWRNIREPVAFHDAAAGMTGRGLNLFVEIGPHPVLRGYAGAALEEADLAGRTIPTLQRGDDRPALVDAAASLALLAGAPMDWSRVFQWRGRHADLPPYPWQRESYWHEPCTDSAGRLSRRRVHPLLGYAAPDSSRRWDNEIDAQAQPWLGDHVVDGSVVFPGAAHAEIALALAAQDDAGDCLAVEDLAIHAPLALAPGASRRLRVETSPDGGSVEVLGRDPAPDAAWVRHMSARLPGETHATLLAGLDVAVPDRSPDFDAEGHYGETRRAGLDYGPAFRTVLHGWREPDGTVLARLDAGRAASAAWLLAPALLDGAFQLLAHGPARAGKSCDGTGAAGDPAAFVPVRIGRLLLRRHAPAPVLARAQVLRRGRRSLLLRITLHDEHGRAQALLDEVRFRAVPRHGRRQPPAMFDEVLIPVPHPAADAVLANPLAAPLVQAALQPGLHEAAAGAELRRYVDEIDPLLDALCARYTLQALQTLADGEGFVAARALQARRDVHPGAAAWLDHAVTAAEADGTAEPRPGGWLLRPPADRLDADELWRGMLRDYPGRLDALLAIGRAGRHLAALLQNRAGPAPIPPAFAPLHACRDPENHLRAALAGVLAEPPGRAGLRHRMSVLEIGGEAPVAAVACCAAQDRVAYRYLALDETDLAALRERHPGIRADALEALPDEAGAGHDLVILHDGLPAGRPGPAVLRRLQACIAPDATLMLVACHPSRWRDFACGVDPSWWRRDEAGAARGSQMRAEGWRALLDQAGWQVLPALDYAPGAGCGPYVLLAQRDDPRAAPCTAAARHVLLLRETAGQQSGDDALADALAARLAQAGHQVRVEDCADPAQAPGLIRSARQRMGALDAVACLPPPAAGRAGEAAPAQAIERAAQRCLTAAAAVRGSQSLPQPPAVWLLTRGAVQAGEPTACLDATGDAALWAFGRTLMNEAAPLAVQLADLPAQAGATAAMAETLALSMTQPDGEREIAVTAAGRRLAPRVRPLPPAGQGARDEETRGEDAQDASDAAPQDAPDEDARNARPQAWRLDFDQPGQLRNLRWEPVAARAPAAGEIEVEVRATGLNFRDLMYTLGLLPDEALENGYTGPALGLEFAGVVLRAGPGVAGLAPGDAVAGFAAHGFSTRLTTSAHVCSRLPAGLSFEAAATVPSVFLTVYYALHHLAGLQAGERVLIHGAAGGVGLAAIQVARWRGARIHATAGSEDKRDLLRLLGVEHIHDSRSLAYADEVLAATGGEGVDVVLNALAGEAINRNLRVLRPFGRHIELGKRDFYEDSRIGLRPLRNNISFHGVDADQLVLARPDLARRLYQETMALFESGVLHPLPYRSFPASAVTEAFRHMQRARHVGKIVVDYRDGIAAAARAPQPPPGLSLEAGASYLVTGGLRGFGLRTAQWLASRGARHLVLVGRSGRADDGDESAQALAALRAQGVRVHARACDVASEREVAALLDDVAATLPPVRGIVHAAAVYDDGLAHGLTARRLHAVLAPKVLGAWHLHAGTLARGMALDFFVMYSSASTLLGNPGQGSYVAANGWLEALARARRQAGLPAACLRWGAIDDAGFLARNPQVKQALAQRMGGEAMPAAQALDALPGAMRGPSACPALLALQWPALARALPAARTPRFERLARLHPPDPSAQADGGGEDLAALARQLPEAALRERLSALIRQEAGRILQLPAQRVPADRPLQELGLDSLMGVELLVALEARTGARLGSMALGEHATPDGLAGRLAGLLRDGPGRNDEADDDGIEGMLKKHGLPIPAAQEASAGETQALRVRP